MRAALLLGCALLLAGCDRNEITGPTAPLNTNFTLAPGDSITVDAIGVRFLRVLNDFRCPLNAICVTAGDAVFTIAVSTTSDGREYEMRANTLQSVTHGGYTIQLVELMPYPMAPNQIPLTNYRATLRVTR
jgi:hypothetical protein